MSFSEIYCAFHNISLKSEENKLSVHEAKVGYNIQYKILSQFETRMDCSHSESEVFKIHKSETIKHSSVFTIILSTWIQHLWSSEQIPPEVETALCSPPGTDRSPSPQRAPEMLLICFLMSQSLKDQRKKKGYLAHRWDDLEGIKVIQGVHPRSSYFAELQTHEPEI